MLRLKKLGFGFLALLILLSGISIVIPPKANAATAEGFAINVLTDSGGSYADVKSTDFTLRWIDAAHLQITSTKNPTVSFLATPENDNGGQSRLYDQRAGSGTAQYFIEGYPCKFDIEFAYPDEVTPITSVKFYNLEFKETSLGGCIDSNGVTFNLTPQNPDLSVAFFRRVDDTTIERADGTITFKSSAEFPNIYTEDGRTGECTNRLLVDGSTVRFFFLNKDFSGSTPAEAQTSCPFRVGSDSGNLEENFIRNNYPYPLAPLDEAVTPGGGTGTGGTASEDNTCESKSGAMGWILCPIINLLDGTLNWVDTQVQALLAIDQDKYTNPSLKTAWVSIRNIAYIVLIPIMLVMVIGTALGFDVFNAYTVKKALPRMVIATIFITFSWEICTFMITFFNVVGSGILGLITSPFRQQMTDLACQNGNLNLSCLFSVDSNISASEGVLRGILFLGEAAAGIIGLILFLVFFGATLLIAIGAAFLVLLARQMFIIALLLVAPLAILAWIFPGNDSVWKGWWSAFSKLLIMFPLIMLIIGVGRIFALLLNITGGGSLDGAVLNPIMKIAAYMLPYAFIPFTFKFAGGLFANLAGVVNDKNKGLFDRARKSRAAKFQRGTSGNLIRNAPKGSLRARANTAFEYSANAKKAGLNPLRMGSNMRTSLSEAADADMDHFEKESLAWQAVKGDDAKVGAARFDKREDIAQDLMRRDSGRFGAGKTQERNDAVNQILRAKKDTSNETFQRARVRAQAKTGTGYQDNQGRFNAAAMIDDINFAYGSDRNGAGKALAEMRSSLLQSGQIAGVAGQGAWGEAMEGMHNKTMGAQEAHDFIMDDAINSAPPGQAVYGKPSGAEAAGAAHAKRIAKFVDSMNNNKAINMGTRSKPIMKVATLDDVTTATAGAAGIYDAMAQASPQNASRFANQLMGYDLNQHGGVTLNQEMQQQRYLPNGQPEVDAAGHAVTDTVTKKVQPGTIRELIQQLPQAIPAENKEFLDRRKEYGVQALQQANAAAAAAAATTGGGPILPTTPPSDRRLKKNIKYLGRTSDGIKIYSFEYIWSPQIFVGVMAQDLVVSHPKALSTDAFGFYKVNYTVLGLEMLTVERWLELQEPYIVTK